MGANYGPEIDVFALGVAMWEFFNNHPYISGMPPGSDSSISCIFIDHFNGERRFKFPTETEWPGVSSLQHYNALKAMCDDQYQAKFDAYKSTYSGGTDINHVPPHPRLEDARSIMGPEAYAVYEQMIRIVPSQRPSAQYLLDNAAWLATTEEAD